MAVIYKDGNIEASLNNDGYMEINISNDDDTEYQSTILSKQELQEFIKFLQKSYAKMDDVE